MSTHWTAVKMKLIEFVKLFTLTKHSYKHTVPGGSDGRVCLQWRRCEFHPWVGKIPWRRAWQPTPVFLPGESHAQRSPGSTVHRVTKSWAKQLMLHSLQRLAIIIPAFIYCY